MVYKIEKGIGGYWCVADKDGWDIVCCKSPAEARREARRWYLYLTAPTDEIAEKYITGEIEVK